MRIPATVVTDMDVSGDITFQLSEPQHTPDEEGYCYLALFEDLHHSRAAALLGRYPHRSQVEACTVGGDTIPLYPGTLRLTFGTTLSAKRTNALICHVQRVPATHSFLKARTLLQITPYGAMYGSRLADPEQPESTQNLSPLALSCVAPDPTLRRFCFKCGEFDTGKKLGVTRILLADAFQDPNVQTWLRMTSYAEIVSLEATLIPEPAASYYFCNAGTAWFPETETAPNNETTFQALPGHQPHALGPRTIGGLPDSLSVPCSSAWGVQLLAKPLPLVGGRPKFAILHKNCPAHNVTFAADVPLYSLYFSIILSSRPRGQ